MHKQFLMKAVFMIYGSLFVLGVVGIGAVMRG